MIFLIGLNDLEQNPLLRKFHRNDYLYQFGFIFEAVLKVLNSEAGSFYELGVKV